MAQAVRGFARQGRGPRARPRRRGRALLGDHPFLTRSAARRAERPAAAARARGSRSARAGPPGCCSRSPSCSSPASRSACGCCRRAGSSATSTSSSCGSTGSPSTAGTAPTTRTSASPPSWRGCGGRSPPSSPRSGRVTDSADPGIRSLMKIPASLADLGIAAAAIWWFRDRPKLRAAGRRRRPALAGDVVRVRVVGPVRVDLRAAAPSWRSWRRVAACRWSPRPCSP